MIDESALKSIEKLHEMKAAGILSEAEFDEAKQKLLAGGRSAAVPRTERISAAVNIPGNDDHLAWMLLPLRRYVDFTGRSSRREFWMFLLFTNLIALALGVVAVADTNIFGQPGTLGILALMLLAVGALGVLVPFVAVEVRRFHDQGRSGWFALLNLIPYIGPIIVLGFMLVPGGAGSNAYGDDPLA